MADAAVSMFWSLIPSKASAPWYSVFHETIFSSYNPLRFRESHQTSTALGVRSLAGSCTNDSAQPDVLPRYNIFNVNIPASGHSRTAIVTIFDAATRHSPLISNVATVDNYQAVGSQVSAAIGVTEQLPNEVASSNAQHANSMAVAASAKQLLIQLPNKLEAAINHQHQVIEYIVMKVAHQDAETNFLGSERENSVNATLERENQDLKLEITELRAKKDEGVLQAIKAKEHATQKDMEYLRAHILDACSQQHMVAMKALQQRLAAAASENTELNKIVAERKRIIAALESRARQQSLKVDNLRTERHESSDNSTERVYQHVRFYHGEMVSFIHRLTLHIWNDDDVRDLLYEMVQTANFARSWLDEVDGKRKLVHETTFWGGHHIEYRKDDVTSPTSSHADVDECAERSYKSMSAEEVEYALCGSLPVSPEIDVAIALPPVSSLAVLSSDSRTAIEPDEAERLAMSASITHIESQLGSDKGFFESDVLAGGLKETWAMEESPESHIWDPSQRDWVAANRLGENGDIEQQVDALTPSPTCYHLCDPRKKDLFAHMRDLAYEEGEIF
ncbi:hypothetical protein QFC21_006617 [Naganishia friedmannii]|uniref:Uncharacterized protein n=1 Tax=Naganishia friedmannii TaxID=89922 RepID=A0ACC2V0P7_9TREE|nr:hypothetical protein QFC21_006617 [Naganishia friedmannii]